jgi:tripartite-type tricarboxylate transporter receptor subunit TctC
MTSTRDLVKSGRLRALATTTSRRSPSWSEIPTVAESGVPGFEVSAWFGVLAPAGTPGPIIARLSAELTRMLRNREVREGLLAQGSDPVGSTPEEFGRHLRTEIDKWSKVVQASGLRAD